MSEIKRNNSINHFIMFCLLSAVLITACSGSQLSPYEKKNAKEADWDRYESTELQLVIDEYSGLFNLSQVSYININTIAAHKPYRIKVTYMDKYRDVSKGKKQLITMLSKSVNMGDDFIELFKHEMLFKYGSKSFWFPIQSSLIPYCKKELKNGDAVNLYVMLIGTIWEENQLQWVFVVNEFRTEKDQSIRDADACFNRGVAHGKNGEHQQAIEEFNKAIEINPKDADFYYNRGIAYCYLGNYQKTIESYDKVIELNPQHSLAYFGRGSAYDKLNNHYRAIENYKIAARLGHKKSQDILKSESIVW